jgi:preprotein translocase subunit YajC
MGVISAFIIIGTFYLAWFLTTTPTMSREQSNMANLVLGYAFGLANTVTGYYFMSSKSSREKTNMMKDMMNNSATEDSKKTTSNVTRKS